VIKNAVIYISDKIEEFRIASGGPSYIGLTSEVREQLENELRAKERVQSEKQAVLTEFLGLPVITMGGPLMPEDGVYIHKRND